MFTATPTDIETMALVTSSDIPARASVLIVDGDSEVRDELAAALASQGFTVYTAGSGHAALALAWDVRPDIVVLEVDLAGMDGFGVLRRLRADHLDAAVVFLTARDTLPDKLKGLTDGGEDYITKPFSEQEVAVRLRVVLRRTFRTTIPRTARRLAVGDVELDENSHEVWKTGVAVALSPTEFRLLHYFMSNTGKVLSHARIIDDVWHRDGGSTNLVHTTVRYLRRKIDTDGSLLRTVRGVGYALHPPPR